MKIFERMEMISCQSILEPSNSIEMTKTDDKRIHPSIFYIRLIKFRVAGTINLSCQYILLCRRGLVGFVLACLFCPFLQFLNLLTVSQLLFFSLVSLFQITIESDLFNCIKKWNISLWCSQPCPGSVSGILQLLFYIPAWCGCLETEAEAAL